MAITQSLFQSAIDDGRAFVLNRNGIIAAGSEVTPTHILYLVDATNSDLKIHHIFANAFEGDVSVEIYANPTIGTPFADLVGGVDLFYNKRIGSSVTPKFTAKVSTNLAHVNSLGTPLNAEVISEATIGSAGKFFTNSAGTEHGDIISQGNTWLFKMTNIGAASTIKIHLEFEQDIG